MKKILFCILAFLCFQMVKATPIDKHSARNFAAIFWNKNCLDTRNTLSPSDFTDITEDVNLSNIYIFQPTIGQGFIILSANDCARPVLAFSTESDFDTENLPQSVYDWLLGYEMQINEAINAKCEALPEVAQEWEMLRNGYYSTTKSTNSVSPLITAQWGQGSYYNAMCPTNTLVGCVAVAMGQVMHYWQHPIHGTGSHSYTYNGITHSVNFEDATYNYASMPTSLSSNNTAVATLLYHCGVAINMEYSSSSSNAYVLYSSAHPNNAESSLKNYFGYSQQAQGKLRSNYTKAQWIEMLKNDLDAGHPVIHNGYNASNSGGHCFICDGYNNNDYFHFNWGQRGNYDGYFDLDAMTPISSQNFSYNQGGIFGLVPAQEGEGIEDFEQSAICIYPNPANNIVHVSIQKDVDFTGGTFAIYDLLGNLLMQDDIQSSEWSVDISNLSTGTYFIHILSNEHHPLVKKIIKK